MVKNWHLYKGVVAPGIGFTQRFGLACCMWRWYRRGGSLSGLVWLATVEATDCVSYFNWFGYLWHIHSYTHIPASSFPFSSIS